MAETTNSQQQRLREDEKIAIYAVLLSNSKNGRPRYGDVAEQARLNNVSTRTIRRIWTTGQSARSFETIVPKRRKQTEIESLQEQVAKLTRSKKMDIRTMAEALSIPRSTLHRHLKDGQIVRKHSSLKPLLTESNMQGRLNYALSFASASNGVLRFDPMWDRVFLDEKFFYLRKVRNKFYLAPWEDVPHQSTRNKRFIPSIMFLSAVARPRFTNGSHFNGKIGIWPFVQEVAAQTRPR